MSITRKLLMTSGGGKKDFTFVDDVYQSHLYDGKSASRSIGNGIKLGTTGLGYSVQFDGHTDFLSLASTSDFNFGTGDFTIEFWALSDSYSGSPYFCDFRDDGGNTGTTNRIVWYTSSSDGKPRFWLNGSARITATNATTNGSWAHYALVRNSGTTTMYIGGVSQGTYSDSTNYGDAPLTIGQRKGNYASQSYDGKISDFRIVKGTAVYTSAFSPPTKALGNIANTVLLCCNQETVAGYTVSPVPITLSTTDEDLMSASGPFTLPADEVKGGLVWIKNRKNSGYGHFLFDTERGVQQALAANLTNLQFFEGNGVKAFNADGFDLGDDAAFNTDGQFYQSYTFAKSEAFFDIVTYSGNSTSGRQIPHNLGCVPGCVLVKRLTTSNSNWAMYHRGVNGGVNPENYWMVLNENYAKQDQPHWNDTAPTSTHFTVGNDWEVNGPTSQNYVAYVFAGGESTAATARSVEFDGSGDYLTISRNSTSDFNAGSNDYTLEFWINKSSSTNNGYNCVFDSGRIQCFYIASSQKIEFYSMDTPGNYVVTMTTPNNSVPKGQWSHVAICRNGSDHKVYINGTVRATATSSTAVGDATLDPTIGQNSNQNYIAAQISNLRWVNGTAVYTESFRPPYEPLTNITNTKLLCCNNSSTTGSTVTPGTITASGNPVASTDSPFDDPEGFKFGKGGDQNIIKCGSYTGNGSTDGPEVYVGWEPQWLLIKRTSGTEDWMIFDPIRTSERNDMFLDEFRPNIADAEGDGAGTDSQPFLNWTPTGFKLMSASPHTNSSGDNYMYIAIRREDGYVGKPATIGSEVFTPTFGTPGAPMFLSSGHVVDYALQKSSYQSGSADWTSIARLVSNERLETNQNLAEQYNSNQSSDFQFGWSNYTGGDGTRFAWLFKRHAGMDVVSYKGTGSNRTIAHSMGVAPTMMWVKRRNANRYWGVYHSGLGDNRFLMRLNEDSDYTNDQAAWNNTAPTAFEFSVGTSITTNADGDDYIAMLFASINGISKVGYYDGNSGTQTITTGFQPRFLIIKRTDSTGYWAVLDTVRGWTTYGGTTNYLQLDKPDAQNSYYSSYPTSTGFVMDTTNANYNVSGGKYIYYAHA